MKKVVFCEGKHDQILMEELLGKAYFDTKKVRRFIQKSDDKKEQKHDEESKELKTFLNPRNKHEVLIKSEGGKDHTVRVLFAFISFLSKHNDLSEISLLVDLDAEGYDELTKRLKEKLEKRRAGLDVKEITKKKVCGLFYSKNQIINKSNSDNLVVFHLLAFEPSLEKLAGIDDLDKEETIRRKIREYLEKNKKVKIQLLSMFGYSQ